MNDISLRRRACLKAAGAFAAAGCLTGHTPYNQWKIFRQRFLLIHTSREDPEGDVLGDALAAALLKHLPASRAQVARGPTDARTASLLSTGQAEVAVLQPALAWALSRAAPPFQDFFATPLQVLVENDRHQLVCVDRFPRHHGYLVARAVMNEGEAHGLRVPQREAGSPEAEFRLPTHAGALAFARGESLDG
ncbi:MAG: hypothetical protein U1F52_05065 [Burkholderiales bacterium]